VTEADRGGRGLRPRLVKALWPPVLGWVPIAILLAVMHRIPPHGGGVIVVPFLTSWAAVVCCVWNAARVARWRDLAPRSRLALVAANLTFPLGFAALMFVTLVG
jgi:hypothetical protein